MFQKISSRCRLTVKSFNLDLEYPHTRNTSKKVNKILDDFANQISVLESVIWEAGHECIFLHKFHCELDPIEIVSPIFPH